MKISVIVDVPEDENIIDPLSPFETKIQLDYGDTVLYLDGEVEKIDR